MRSAQLLGMPMPTNIITVLHCNSSLSTSGLAWLIGVDTMLINEMAAKMKFRDRVWRWMDGILSLFRYWM